LFRVQSGNTYYRLQMDVRSNFGSRLEKVVNGVITTLAQTNRTFQLRKWTRVEVQAHGPNLSARLDDEELLFATDSTLASGGVGFFCFENDSVRFDDAEVRRLATEAPVTTVSGVGGSYQFTFQAPGANTSDLAFLLFSGDLEPAISLSGLDPLQRMLPVRIDSLLSASLEWANLRGFTAAGCAQFGVQVPPDPGLIGKRLFASGLLLENSGAIKPLATAPMRIR
jgi:hypothetical protein